MKTLTLDDVTKMPPLTEAERKSLQAFKNTDFSDCPRQSAEELKQFRPWREVRRAAAARRAAAGAQDG